MNKALLHEGDMLITCIESDCGLEFIFTSEEQDYYKINNLTFPKRCRACRQRRKVMGRKT